jgi:hypothetical protein
MKLGGRKIMLGAGVIAVGVVMDFIGPKGLTGSMVSLLSMVSIGYFGANVIAKGTSAFEKAKAAKRGPVPGNAEMKKLADEVAKLSAEVKRGSKESGNDKVVQAVQGVANQNAVIAQTLSKVAQDTNMVVGVIKQS